MFSEVLNDSTCQLVVIEVKKNEGKNMENFKVLTNE